MFAEPDVCCGGEILGRIDVVSQPRAGRKAGGERDMSGRRSLAEAWIEDDAGARGQQGRASARAVGHERGVMLHGGHQRGGEFVRT